MSSPVVNKISKLNDSIITFLETPVIKYGFLILVILQIIMISSMSIEYLELYDNNSVKVIYAFLIAYYACFDPVYAIALTTLMIVSIQELHSRRAIGGIKKIGSIGTDSALKDFNYKHKVNIKQCNKVSNNDAYIYNEINKHALQKTPNANDTLTAEYDYNFSSGSRQNENSTLDPAFKTITGNLENAESKSKFQMLTTDADLLKAETNIIQGVNQNLSNQPFDRPILNIQGLPNGYDPQNINKYELQ